MDQRERETGGRSGREPLSDERGAEPPRRGDGTGQRRWERGERGGGGRSVSDETRTSYYGLPVIKKPHWRWLIVAYFFLGGISGASYAVASIAEIWGGKEARPIVRAGRYLSFAALLPSPLLLILDLGRPERFLYMLRVFKLRSPMSVGTWGLTVFGGFCTLSTLIQAARDGLLRPLPGARLLGRLPSRGIGAAGSFFGFFMSGYTGVLLAATAVPLWARNHLLIPPLFVASALSSATAAIALLLAPFRAVSHAALRRVEHLDLLAQLVELGLLVAIRRHSGPVIGRPLDEGRTGLLYRWGVLGGGLGAPIALHLLAMRGAHRSRMLLILSSALTLAGGFGLRALLVFAGRVSADDPHATFAMTRSEERRAALPAAGRGVGASPRRGGALAVRS